MNEINENIPPSYVKLMEMNEPLCILQGNSIGNQRLIQPNCVTWIEMNQTACILYGKPTYNQST